MAATRVFSTRLDPTEARKLSTLAHAARVNRSEMLAILLRNAAGLTLAAPVTVHFGNVEEVIGSVESRGKFTHAANGPAQPTHGTKTPRG